MSTFKPVILNQLKAREVMDSRGFPTVEVEARSGQFWASAIVPSGASTGEGEALELRDGDAQRYLGKGVLTAVNNVNTTIASAVLGRSFETIRGFDQFLIELDATENKSKLGANAILAVSMAFCRVYAQAQGLELSQLVAKEWGASGTLLPVPLMNVVNGGKHADNGLAIQEFMIVPHGFERFSDAFRAGVETFHHLKKLLHKKGLSTSVGDEGGFAPLIQEHEKVIDTLLEAIQLAGYKPKTQISLALDCASSEYAQKTDKGIIYHFEGQELTSDQMVEKLALWASRYPIVSIEDGLAEWDWDGWSKLTQKLGKSVQLVGDDLFVTNPKTLKKGIDQGVGNSILIKLNQIGTVSETCSAMKMAREARYTTVVSHRSGESEDSFIADLAVGSDAGQIKTGSASRTDRMAKYNQLLRLEERLGASAKFLGNSAFKSIN